MSPAAEGSAGVALVTGGARGFGRASALALGRAGFKVGIVARSEGELQATHELLAAAGVDAASFVADVTDLIALDAAVHSLQSDLGPITALVNNAGTLAAIGPVWDADPVAWWGDVETTLRGAFNACRCVVPGMVERRTGRIVNVSSYAGVRPSPYQSGYACAKAALLSLTDALASSLEPHGVRAFSVSPGFVVTEMTRHLTESPEGRRWLPDAGTGTVVDIDVGAQLVALLCSGGADALNGRFVHALDDVAELLRCLEQIETDDLYAPRLRRLPRPS
jgi:3-oxoacyl-[acyl-carrier protein] reductase